MPLCLGEKEEVERLRNLVSSGDDTKVIKISMGRKTGAIRSRIKKLGL